jgi:anti-sigma B factor antagonist
MQAQEPALRVSSRHQGVAIVVTAAGRVDHLSAAAFEQALVPQLAQAAAAKHALVLDFAGVDYISSVGLRVLMIAAKQAREQAFKLLVAAPQTVVAEIFAISRFNRVLAITASVDEALALAAAP